MVADAGTSDSEVDSGGESGADRDDEEEEEEEDEIDLKDSESEGELDAGNGWLYGLLRMDY